MRDVLVCGEEAMKVRDSSVGAANEIIREMSVSVSGVACASANSPSMVSEMNRYRIWRRYALGFVSSSVVIARICFGPDTERDWYK